jgi:hypothetical protein
MHFGLAAPSAHSRTLKQRKQARAFQRIQRQGNFTAAQHPVRATASRDYYRWLAR